MKPYDPDKAPSAEQWLELDEGLRIESVVEYHQRHKIKMANVRLHAAIHAVVENQLAINEQTVVETMARLQTEGLSRHDAIHAIGSVLSEQMFLVMRGGGDRNTLALGYLEKLKSLSAESWRSLAKQ